jgi:glycosyltransferase involved in cell wall biosynthesis
MMRIMINALAASAGAGLTYVRNVVPHLAVQPNMQTAILLRPALRQELHGYQNVTFIEREVPAGAGRRFWYEQSKLPELIRGGGVDVLVSAGNFSLRNSPVPQILLSGNSLYTSRDFLRDLGERRDYRLWLDTKIKAAFAKRSVHWANVTVAPSAAFAEQLREWAGGRIVAIHHGFDRDAFFGDGSPLPADIAAKLQHKPGDLRLLLVSHYNYYRNFETLLRALPRLRQLLPGRNPKLLVTCTFRSEDNPGRFHAESAAALVRQLGIADDVVQLGAIPYRHLHYIYGACDLYVTPAYTETFAHHVVEAMASGLPVVASDLPLHREICGDAAVYFPRFTSDDLAARVVEVAGSERQMRQMSELGREASKRFSWSAHVREIVALAASLIQK